MRSFGLMLTLALLVTVPVGAASTYYYLPDALNAEEKISAAEMAALKLTAYYNCSGNLTSKLVRQSVRCFLGSDSVDLFVDTLPQTGWNVHMGGAKFSCPDAEVARAYAEAGAVAMDWLVRFFPGVPAPNMRVVFTIKGYQIGTYTQGKFTIAR